MSLSREIQISVILASLRETGAATEIAIALLIPQKVTAIECDSSCRCPIWVVPISTVSICVAVTHVEKPQQHHNEVVILAIVGG